MIRGLNRNTDFILIAATLPIFGAGLVTMWSFVGENNFFERQLVWIAISMAVCILASFVNWGFLKNSFLLLWLYIASLFSLATLLSSGRIVRGVHSWFSFGGVSFQPADFVKLILILVLAKYFSRRHIEIANVRHIFVSGVYASIPAALVLLQPDFGSAVVVLSVWIGMIMVSGISKKHLALVAAGGVFCFGILWAFVLAPYQKDRIRSFIHPVADVRGIGYNAYQSQIAVGSGGIFGKGVGYGTQSRLSFLPEYQTDFIFAAFAEEWGFIGVVVIFALYGLILWRILGHALIQASNFEMLFGIGLAVYFTGHIVINIGMNIGLLPVTGIPLPFMSYGGSHVLTEYLGLGMLMGMRRYARAAHRDDMKNEFLGPA